MHDFLKMKEHNRNPKESLEQSDFIGIYERIRPGRTNIMIYLLFIQSMHSSNCTQ